MGRGILCPFIPYNPDKAFILACLSNIIKVLFPFKYPTKLDTLILGGISTSI